jgi:hypothetical protein
VIYILFAVMCVLHITDNTDINITGRGLAALLILGEGQCEGLITGMGEK